MKTNQNMISNSSCFSASKKLFLALCSLASVNVFAYTLTVTNNSVYTSSKQSGADIVLHTQTSDQVIPAGTSSFNIDEGTIYEIKTTTPGQTLASLKKDSTQYVIQATPQSNSTAWQNITVSYSTSNGYSGSFKTMYNTDGTTGYSGSCMADGAGVTCSMSNNQSVSSASITLADGSSAPAPKPVDPTPIKSVSGMYYSDNGVWDSTVTYAPYWNNSINNGNGGSVYPMVISKQDNKTYVACYGTDLGKDPATVYATQSWGPWLPFDKNQANSPC